ncbi:hypothetical protein K1719_038954 [Acacia pycnantha]|nr:hypothetical protein K1719_038954 [Acacia pycnantha]
MDQDYMNHSLHLTVDALRGEIQYNCQIDVKPWHFWIKKGYKSFIVDGHQVARSIGTSGRPSSPAAPSRIEFLTSSSMGDTVETLTDLH